MVSTATGHDGKKLCRLAVVGAGIGGLTFVIALKGCTNIQVDLYEQAHQISEIGAGIAVNPRTWKMLESFGLKEDLVRVLGEEPSKKPSLAIELRLSDRKEGFTFHKLYDEGGTSGFHRKEFQGALLKHVPDFCNIHLLHRLTRCKEEADSVKLFFQDGSEATCDILVAADGIKSVARDLIPNEGLYYTGTNIIRSLIPMEAFAKLYPNHRVLRDSAIMFYCGKDRHVVAYPISRGQVINVAVILTNLEHEGKPFEDPKKPITTEELLDIFSGWEDEVIQLVRSMEHLSRWILRDLNPLKTYVSRRIALLGDAAHGMRPYLGAGAGQAIEDSYILGQLFAKANSASWLRVLEAYNLVRQPFANMVQSNSRKQGYLCDLNAPEFENVKLGQELLPEQLEFLSKATTQNVAWWEDDASKHLARAIEFLTGERQ